MKRKAVGTNMVDGTGGIEVSRVERGSTRRKRKMAPQVLRSSFKRIRGSTKRKQRSNSHTITPSGETASLSSVRSSPAHDDRTKVSGWLYKWTNAFHRYQKRWFVLSNGYLSYYYNQTEMEYRSRASMSLVGATIQVAYGNHIVITNGSCTRTFYLQATNKAEKQSWIEALERSKAQSIEIVGLTGERKLKTGDDGNESFDNDLENMPIQTKSPVVNITSKVEDLSNCSNHFSKQGSDLVELLNKLQMEKAFENASPEERDALKEHINVLNEMAANLKMTSETMVKAASGLLMTLKEDREKGFEIEEDLKQEFEAWIDQYAEQDSRLEEYVCKVCLRKEVAPLALDEDDQVLDSTNASCMSSGSDDVFYDTITHHEEVSNDLSASPCLTCSGKHCLIFDGAKTPATTTDKFVEAAKTITEREEKVKNEQLVKSDSQRELKQKVELLVPDKVIRKRRKRIPDRPNTYFNMWSLIKNSIGKDLTKMPVPVNFSEPLSMLQRLTESDLEYADILDRAAEIQDDCEQMAYVTAFTVSAYSTTATRSTKPFNPLLGETFECDRSEDKGWRSIMEQVSHHPPKLAQYAESSSEKWQYWQEFSMQTKFKGPYMDLIPLGIAHLVFPKSGNHYTWRKVTTVVHNLIIGRLWIDQVGEMDIINHTKNIKCHLKFDAYSYFRGTPKKVSGVITNTHNLAEFVVNGTWDTKLDVARVWKEPYEKGKSFVKMEDDRNLWTTNVPDPGYEKYYKFTAWACEMNEPEEGVAPTDSRLRPDQRMMENGDWDDANTEKIRLEEKQRAVRRKKEETEKRVLAAGRTPEPYQPTWFTAEIDHMNDGKLVHKYHGGYWEAKKDQRWDMCPDIY